MIKGINPTQALKILWTAPIMTSCYRSRDHICTPADCGNGPVRGGSVKSPGLCARLRATFGRTEHQPPPIRRRYWRGRCVGCSRRFTILDPAACAFLPVRGMRHVRLAYVAWGRKEIRDAPPRDGAQHSCPLAESRMP